MFLKGSDQKKIKSHIKITNDQNDCKAFWGIHIVPPNWVDFLEYTFSVML